MKLTVIVAVYNTSKYLRKCLDSILEQTYQNIEIIVVDDGSTDNSFSVLEEYKNKYPDKIVLLQKENGGQGSARNLALTVATGDYITFVDSDDTIDKNMYKEMMNLIKKEKCDIAICGIEDYYEKNNTSQNRSFFNEKNISISDALINSVPSVVNKIYKTNLFKKSKIVFNEKIWYEDFPYSLELIVEAKKICYINKPFYRYFHRVKSTMHNENITKNLDILEAYDDLLTYFKENNYYEIYQEELSFLLLKEVFIATINRIIRTNNKSSEKKKVIRKIKDYCKKNSLRKTKYFSQLSSSYKLSYYLIKFRLYFIVRIMFKWKEKFS